MSGTLIVGYCRVSSTDQDCSIQEAALTAAGATRLYSEKKSGTTLKGRTQLERVLDVLRKGDTLLVVRLDRLGRDMRDILNTVHDLVEKGVILKATEQPFDTSSVAGKAMLGMLAVFAELENGLRRERQLAGIAKAKREGRYNGRPRTVDVKAVRAARARGLSITDIAAELGIGRASVHRALGS
jgi:DNA invertase Pin-like site-specific DNA recombinase